MEGDAAAPADLNLRRTKGFRDSGGGWPEHLPSSLGEGVSLCFLTLMGVKGLMLLGEN